MKCPQEFLGLLDVGDVRGDLDHMQRPAEPRARRLGDPERDHPVVAAPQQRRRDRDAPQRGVGNPLRPADTRRPIVRLTCLTRARDSV